MSANQRLLVVCEGVTRSELPDGEMVVSNGGNDKAVILNPTASAIVELCDGTRDQKDIAAFLCDALPGPEVGDVERDVAGLVAQLCELGVLEERE